MKFKRQFEKIITYVFFAMLAITGLWDYFKRDGEKIWRILLIYATIFLLYYVYKKTFLKKYNISYTLILIFIFISMYLANIWNFYGLEYYDKFLHFTSGILTGFFGIIFYIEVFNYDKKEKSKYKIITIFTFIFVVAVAGAWEVWEFSTDQLFGLTAQNNDLHDTMWDIICASIGGVIPCYFAALYEKGKKVKMIENLINVK